MIYSSDFYLYYWKKTFSKHSPGAKKTSTFLIHLCIIRRRWTGMGMENLEMCTIYIALCVLRWEIRSITSWLIILTRQWDAWIEDKTFLSMKWLVLEPVNWAKKIAIVSVSNHEASLTKSWTRQNYGTKGNLLTTSARTSSFFSLAHQCSWFLDFQTQTMSYSVAHCSVQALKPLELNAPSAFLHLQLPDDIGGNLLSL